MSNLVIYHANCRDGFGAALAAWMRFGDDATYHPAQYDDDPPQIEAGQIVYIVDFSYPRDVLERIAQAARMVVVLDHHKTAAEALAGLPPAHPHEPVHHGIVATFDMDKSGAVLAWEFFHHEQEVPRLFLYLQDRDLWKWAFPHSREVSAGVDLLPFEFDTWRHYAQHGVGALMDTGSTVLAYQRKLVAQAANNQRMDAVGPVIVPVVNTGTLISEVCEELLKRNPDAPYAACYFDQGDKRIYSLRSRDGSEIDVSAVAKAQGGGGHKHAAGFSVPLDHAR